MTYVAPKHVAPGINFLFIVRFLLEKCSSVAEAIKELKRMSISSSQNIILADKSGEMAVVECCSKKIVVRRPNEGESFIIATNNFIHPEMIEYDGCPQRNWYYSETRYKAVQEALRNSANRYSIDYAKEILSGKLGFVCQYERKLKFDTLWSFVVRLNDLKMCRSEGNPSKDSYREDTRLEWAIGKGR
jgi:predicted choloylglycine hydrolase